MAEVNTADVFGLLGLFAIHIVSIVAVIFLLKNESRKLKACKRDLKRSLLEKKPIENSKVYLKYGKDFRGDYFFSGLFLMMFTVMICLLFFVPAMEYKIELLGETVSEQEPTFLNMILEVIKQLMKQLTDVEIHSAVEAFAYLPQYLFFLLAILLAFLPFITVAFLILLGLIYFLQQTYYLFVDGEEYEKISFMHYRGRKFLGYKNNMIRNNREAILNLTVALPFIFVLYGIFRALFYHAEKDELLEGLGIHMTMTVGMIFMIILAVLCLACGIYFMMKYKNTKKKIMQEPIEYETAETTETKETST